MRTLSARLVLTAVLLVAAASLLVGTTTTLVMRDYLQDQLDDKVTASARRAVADVRGRPPGGFGQNGPGAVNQEPGTLIARPDEATGQVLSDRRDEGEQLDPESLELLADIPVDGEVHEVALPGRGDYRVVAFSRGGQTLVAGLPTADLDDTVGSLVTWQVLLGLLGTVTAAIAGTVVVRRQLKPLTEVAATAHAVSALPLASGDIALDERVPDRLTDERTEVGQVGAALNTLLSHVESALDSRQRSEAQVRQFVADASHELRTPLATIQGYVELATRRPEDADVVRVALEKVSVASHRMSDLVADLLLLARLDSGRPLEQAPVDLTRLVLETVADARMLGPDHDWRLDLPDEPVEVTGDEQRLHQVLTNLLTNARTHTPPGTVVTVSLRPGEVRVHDDGPGFPRTLESRAFERFTRGDDARVRGGGSGGAGLGLSLVRAIVAAHGGDVALASRPGDTTVTVRLPS